MIGGLQGNDGGQMCFILVLIGLRVLFGIVDFFASYVVWDLENK